MRVKTLHERASDRFTPLAEGPHSAGPHGSLGNVMFPASKHYGAIRMLPLNDFDRLVRACRFDNFNTAQPRRSRIGSPLFLAVNPVISPKGFLAPFDDRDLEHRLAHIRLHALRCIHRIDAQASVFSRSEALCRVRQSYWPRLSGGSARSASPTGWN